MKKEQTPDWPATKCVWVSAIFGGVLLTVTAATSNRFIIAATVGPGLMSTWIAAGLGVYGMARYPSIRLLMATIAAIALAALAGAYFWHQMMARRG